MADQPILVAEVADTAATTQALLKTEKPGPYPNGTLCVVRSTRKIWYWDGAAVGNWFAVVLEP